jgi:DNA polymerase III delta subunit
LKHLYIHVGEDFIGLSAAREKLVATAQSTHGDFHHISYDDTDGDLDSYLSDMVSPTLFGDFRFFHIRHMETFSTRDIQKISSYLQSADENSLVLLEYFGMPKKGFPGSLGLSKDAYVYRKFEKPKKYMMGKWLEDAASEYFNRPIDTAAATLLIEHANYDPDKIYGELQKLDTYLSDSETITLDAVKNITGTSVSVKPDDLCDLAGYRDWNRCLKALRDIELHKEHPLMLFFTSLVRHFWMLYKIRLFSRENKKFANSYFRKQYREKNSVAGDIAIAAGVITQDQRNRVYPFIVKRGIINQTAKYSEDEIRNALCLLADFDRRMKRGEVRMEYSSFAELCFRLVKQNESAR